MEIKRIISYGLYVCIGRYLPSTKNSHTGLFERIRSMLVHGYVDHCGKFVNIQPHAIIARRCSIGDYSGVGRNCMIQGGVKIGKHVMMGPDVFIYTQNHNFRRTDISMDQQGWSDEKPVIIEDDVWIGSRVTILPGVIIGTGCIIGASAVVTKFIPPFCVVAGNPAKVVKNRK